MKYNWSNIVIRNAFKLPIIIYSVQLPNKLTPQTEVNTENEVNIFYYIKPAMYMTKLLMNIMLKFLYQPLGCPRK